MLRWDYLVFLILLITAEIFDIVLLRRALDSIKEAQQDGVVTDEEKSIIRVSFLQAAACTLAVVLGFVVVAMKIVESFN